MKFVVICFKFTQKEYYFININFNPIKTLTKHSLNISESKSSNQTLQPEMKSKIPPNLGERLNVEIFDRSEIGLI